MRLRFRRPPSRNERGCYCYVCVYAVPGLLFSSGGLLCVCMCARRGVARDVYDFLCDCVLKGFFRAQKLISSFVLFIYFFIAIKMIMTALFFMHSKNSRKYIHIFFDKLFSPKKIGCVCDVEKLIASSLIKGSSSMEMETIK